MMMSAKQCKILHVLRENLWGRALSERKHTKKNFVVVLVSRTERPFRSFLEFGLAE